MKLTELNPRWVKQGGSIVGVSFDAPSIEPTNPRICYRVCAFFDIALDGNEGRETGHKRTGATFENLTLSPSILTTYADPDNPEKPHWQWHGFLTKGEVTTC